MKNSSSEIRSRFINYFTSKDHTYVDSSSIIPSNDDKSLLFTNSGMVQFKDIFLGLKSAKYKCAVTSQKCIRAGGKHNDLENVGYTNRHHTFFEMLGNFSFGHYFKYEAINFAWDFLTKELQISPDKFWITVHDSDKEAKKIWIKDIGINENKLSSINTNDNFWSMGDLGPCGPCTEIFYDFGDKYIGLPPGHGDEGERYVEIWNLVFMQYNRLADGILIDLPKPSVDTGMGLERICAVMQNEHSNYSTDLFLPMITFIKDNISKKYYNEISSMKVIADHIRSISFLIAEGIRPSNEGHGYVLRRLIRRTIRHSQKINLDSNKFLEIIPIFIDTLRTQYREIDSSEVISSTLRTEISKFSEALRLGLDILDKNMNLIIKEKGKKEVSGELLFLLYDTYGFPIDLTITIASERNFLVDISTFENFMNEQKLNSKKSNKFSLQNNIEIFSKSVTEFTGYTQKENISNILEIYIDKKVVNKINKGNQAYIVINPCPFYAEAGGQIGDSGVIFSEHVKFRVTDTQKRGAVSLLIGEQIEGSFVLNDSVSAKIDIEKRHRITLNHSATHLLHAALIKIIGKNVCQKGSLVSDTKLRFDFSCEQALSKKIINQLEIEVNENIAKNIPSQTLIMNKDKAISEGAIALFGEKYDDDVRVLSFESVSTELCGGTHVSSTGEIGIFKIISESSVSSGVRRIEAMTSFSANQYLNKRDNLLSDICKTLNVHEKDLLSKIIFILDDNKKLKKENSNLLKDIVAFKILKKISNKKLVFGFNFQVINQVFVDGKVLKNIFDDIKSIEKNLILVIIQKNNSKAEIYVLVTKDCFDKINAKDIIHAINASIGSTGGGREELAQAGFQYDEDLDILCFNIEKIITELLKKDD